MVFLLLLILAAGAAAQTTNCPAQDLAIPGSASGALASSDCRVRDLVTSTRTNTYVDQYRITVNARTLVTIRLKSADFNAVLQVCDAQYSCIALNDDADGGADSRLTMSLAQGVWYVLATSKTVTTGGYTIETSTGSWRTCGTQDLAFDQPATGTFSDTGCRALDLFAPSADESYVQQYRLRVLKTGVVKLELSSPTLATSLGVYYRDGTRIASVRGRNKTAKMDVSLEAGTYIVVAGAGEVASGGYTLKAANEPLRACTMKNMELNQITNGALAADSCRILDLWLPSADATYVDVYQIKVPDRSVLTVDMTSTILDTYLVVMDEYGEEVLAENDDAGDHTTDAAITMSLHPGTYLVYANAATVAAGDYQLTTLAEAPRTCDVLDIGVNDNVTGRLSTTGCRFLDLVAPSDDISPVQAYKAVLPKMGMLQVDQTSTEFDSYLGLLSDCCADLWEDDDRGGNANARLELLLPAGAYYILATTAGGTGSYALKTEFRDPPACPVEEIRPNAVAGGAITDGACRLRDVLPGSESDFRVDQFRIVLPRAGTLQASVATGNFDPYVLIMDANYRYVEPDVDPSAVIADVNAGTYSILVVSLNKTGDYTLRADFQ